MSALWKVPMHGSTWWTPSPWLGTPDMYTCTCTCMCNCIPGSTRSTLCTNYRVAQKMSHSVSILKSVLEDQFCFPACVLDSEFWSWFIQSHQQCPFRIGSDSKTTAGTNIFSPCYFKCSEDFTHGYTPVGPVAQTKSVFSGTAVQAPLRNSACVWLSCFTSHNTVFSESQKLNPLWLTGSPIVM